MFRSRKYLFDFMELQRRFRRQLEGKNINYRKLLLIIFLSAVIFLYIGPYIFSWLFGTPKKSIRKPFFHKSFQHSLKCGQFHFCLLYGEIDTSRDK